MPVVCKRCGRDVGDKSSKRVADWVFCEECFQQLMDDATHRAAEPPPEAGPTPAPVKGDAPPAPAAAASCRGCKRALGEGEARVFLGLTFCPTCETVLREGLSPPAFDLAATDAEPPEPEPPRVEQVRVDHGAVTSCHRCRRQVKLLGSREHEGERYCPDCYRAVTAAGPHPEPGEVPRARSGPAQVVRVSVTPAPRPEATCMSCGQVSEVPLEPLEGFAICPACRGTDPALAVEIARARHRRLLEALKQRLDG